MVMCRSVRNVRLFEIIIIVNGLTLKRKIMVATNDITSAYVHVAVALKLLLQ
jgi:hypothetical protein